MSESFVLLIQNDNHWVNEELEKRGIRYPHYITSDFVLMLKAQAKEFIKESLDIATSNFLKRRLKELDSKESLNNELTYQDVFMYFWIEEFFDSETKRLKSELVMERINKICENTFEQIFNLKTQ